MGQLIKSKCKRGFKLDVFNNYGHEVIKISKIDYGVYYGGLRMNRRELKNLKRFMKELTIK